MVANSSAVFDTVKNGDTLLAIALREFDPQSAAALVRGGASLPIENEEGETPMDMIFTAFALLEYRQKKHSGDDADHDPVIKRLIVHEDAYTTLFNLVRTPLIDYHSRLKLSVRQELTRIYTQFAPERVSKIPQQMEDFEYRERLLLESVRRKYLEV